MRIAVLANVPIWTLPGLEYLYRPGHYATWLEALIPEFENYECPDLQWITLSKEVRNPITHEAYGQTFHILPRQKMSISLLTGFLSERNNISKILRRIQPDILHAWGTEDAYALAGAFSGIEKKVFTLQGCLNHIKQVESSFFFNLLARYEKPAVRRYLVGTAESPAACKLLKGLNPLMDIRQLEYGVHRDFFEVQWEPSPMPRLLFLGSIIERKGICDLLEVAKSPEFSHITFMIAGDGELRSSLELLSSPNVVWLGRCKRSEVIRLLSQSWALIAPTYSDTGPTVVKEARVVGLPVITTTSAGSSSYVTHGRNGFVFEAGDTNALTKSLRRVCVSRESCKEMGSFEWDAQRILLRPESTVRNMIELYQTL